MTSIFLLARDWDVFGDEEARRKGRNPRQLELSLSAHKVARRRRRMGRLSFYRKQGWVPQLMELVGLKTWVSGPRTSSTKKEEMFIEKSSFQKVYIS